MAKGSSIPRQKKQVAIVIDSGNLGGESDSPYMGLKNSLTSIVGFDVHSVPGLMLTAQKLKKDSGTTVNDLVKLLPCSDGNMYEFGLTTGQVWKRTSGGTYSLLGTVAPAAGAVGILDAIEFNGNIYYTMQNRLGKWNFRNGVITGITLNAGGTGYVVNDVLTLVGGHATILVTGVAAGVITTFTLQNGDTGYSTGTGIATTGGTGTGATFNITTVANNDFTIRNDNYATFLVGNATFHPIINVNEVLYFGDGNNIAQDDGSVFTGNALVLKAPQVISSLGKQVTDLLIGTTISNSIPLSHVFRWNTWSISYTNDYIVPESGVNAFFPSDNNVIVQAGINGNIYELNGAEFQMLRQVPPNFPTLYTPSNTAQVFYPAIAVLQGIPIFGFSNVSGNPAYQGVYAYGGRAAAYPKILTLPFPISTGNLSNITIWSLAVIGNNLFVSWKDTTSGTVYGVDILDWSNKYNGAFFETRIVKFSRIWLDIFDKIVCNYQSLPANTAINIFYDANWQGYIQYGAVDPAEIITDTDRNEIVANLQVKAKTMRFKVQTTASGNNAPTIEDLIILPE